MERKTSKFCLCLLLMLSFILSSNDEIYASSKNGTKYSNAYQISTGKVGSKVTSSTRNTNKNQIIWYKFRTSSEGEYNVYSNGSCNTYGTLYKKGFWSIKSIKADDNSGSGDNFKIKIGLESNSTYYVAVKAKEKGKYSIAVEPNRDICTSRNFSTQKGGSWKPYSYSRQPYGVSGQCIMKITWLTPGDAAIYESGLADSKYLKMLNTGMQLSSILVSAKISKTSALGKKIMSMGKKEVIASIKTIASIWGGISLVPDLVAVSRNAIKKHTCNYQKGLKVTTMISSYYGTVNAYDTWDLKKTSVRGPLFCRGYFTPGDIEVGGW